MCCMRNLETNAPRNGMVARGLDGRVYIVWTPLADRTQCFTDMTTRDARLLAKRINQFLDGGG